MSYLSMSDKDNDEDFFNGPPAMGGQSSNLGSLFGMSAKMDHNSGSNRSLTYTAPKPPRPDKGTKDTGDKKTAQSGGGGVAAASVITAYRYVNNQYKLQGKLGIALLSNFTEKDYKILMYVRKQQPVATAKILPEFQFSVQTNNYASFYDDQRQMWSVLFDSAEHIINFAKHLCIAKFHCLAQPSVIVQDLKLGESDTELLKPGDLVETKYTGWLIQPQTGSLGAVFDSNHGTDKTFRFKMGKGKVIKGWEEGMQGMKKTGKRFLLIPPTFAYGSKGAGSRVPPNSTLAFEIDVQRIKHQSSSSSIQSSNSTDSVPQTLEQSEPNFGASLEAPFAGMPATAVEEKDELVKGRTASFNDQLTHGGVPTDSNKAKLLSRMAKVGQAMLPTQPGLKPEQQQPAAAQSQVMHLPPEHAHDMNPVQPTFSQSPDPSASAGQLQSVRDLPPNSYSPIPGLAHASGGPHALRPQSDYQGIATSQIVPQMPVQFMQHSSAGNAFLPSGIMSYSQVPRSTYNVAQQLPFSGGDILPSILLESQNNGTKLKTLTEKVDEVSEKISKLKSASESHTPSSFDRSSMEIMDAAQLSFNVQRIVQENERVKKQILERDKLVQTQSDKITDLLRQNQKLMEESHEQLEKRNVSFKERFGQTQEKTLQLEQEKLNLTNQLSNATAQICELQSSLTHMTEKANILGKQMQASSEQNVKTTGNEQRVNELEIDLSAARSQVEKFQNENQRLQNDLNQKDAVENELKQEIEKMRQDSENNKQNSKQDITRLRLQHENEVKSMQDKLQTGSSDASELRAKLEESWKEKCKNAVLKVTKAAEEKLEEVNTERDALLRKLEMFQEKFLQLRGMYEEKVKSEEDLKERLEEFETVRERYDNLRKQAIAMKQKYEATIQELEENANQLVENSNSSADANAQVKSVMNKVFQQVRAEILPSNEYTGSDVLTIILNIIKSTTLTLLTPGQVQEKDDEDEESSQDEEEDEQEEENQGEVEDKDDARNTQSKVNENDSSVAKDASNDEEEDDKEKENPEVEERDGSLDAQAEAVDANNRNVREENLEEGAVESSDTAVSPQIQVDENPPENKEAPSQTKESIAEVINVQAEKSGDLTESDRLEKSEELPQAAEEVPEDEVEDGETVTAVNLAASGDQADENRQNHDTEEEKEVHDGEEHKDRQDGSISPASYTKPSPPPLFDDDDDDDENDLDWLK